MSCVYAINRIPGTVAYATTKLLASLRAHNIAWYGDSDRVGHRFGKPCSLAWRPHLCFQGSLSPEGFQQQYDGLIIEESLSDCRIIGRYLFSIRTYRNSRWRWSKWISARSSYTSKEITVGLTLCFLTMTPFRHYLTMTWCRSSAPGLRSSQRLTSQFLIRLCRSRKRTTLCQTSFSRKWLGE